MESETIRVKTITGEHVLFPAGKPSLIYGLIVTPEVATWFLEFAKDKFQNRHQSDDRVRAYANDMLAKRWSHNGETLKFDIRGVMVDGFTRCVAAFMHNATFVTDVRTGVAEEDVASIDTGRPRSLANVMLMKNEGRNGLSTAALSAGILFAWRYSRKKFMESHYHNRLSHPDALSWLDRHPAIRDSVAATKGVRNKKLAQPGVLVATHWVCKHRSAEKADEFFNLLESGIGLGATSPVRVLREMLLKRTEKRLKSEEAMKAIIHAFNKFCSDEPLRVLKIPEDAPKVRGFVFEE